MAGAAENGQMPTRESRAPTVAHAHPQVPGTELAASPEWLTGLDFSRQRNRRVGVSWTGVPLRDALQQFSVEHDLAIFLDRRVDPTQPVTFSSVNQSFHETLLELCDNFDLAVVLIDKRFYYVGPAEEVPDLYFRRRELLRSIDQLPTEQRRTWMQTAPLELGRLQVPGEAAEELCRDAGIQWDGDHLPHDLWPAVDLPALSLSDRLIVLVNGFGLWPQPAQDGAALQLTEQRPLPPVTIKHDLRMKRLLSRQWMTEHPEVQAHEEGRYLVIQAAPVIHYQLTRLLALETSQQRRRSDGPEPRISKFNAPDASIGSILKRVAELKGVEFQYHDSLIGQLNQRTSLALRDVTVRQLIEAALKGTGLQYELDDQQLRVFQ